MSKAKYQTVITANFLRFSNEFWKFVLQIWRGSDQDQMLKTDIKNFCGQCLNEVSLFPYRNCSWRLIIACIFERGCFVSIKRFLFYVFCFYLTSLGLLKIQEIADKLITFSRSSKLPVRARELHGTIFNFSLFREKYAVDFRTLECNLLLALPHNI